VNEEALAHWELSRQKQTITYSNITCMSYYFDSIKLGKNKISNTVYKLSEDGIVVPKRFGVIKGYIGVYIACERS
jgi:hypothetical protein